MPKKKVKVIVLAKESLLYGKGKELTNSEFRVYCYLIALYRKDKKKKKDNNGYIKLSKEDMAEVKGFGSHHTFYNAIKGLEEKGWVENCGNGGLFKNANKYRLSETQTQLF